MTKEIVQCPECHNFEKLRNVYCRICGAKLPNKQRDRYEIISPWVLMLVGISITVAIGLHSKNETAVVYMLWVSLLFIILSHKIVKYLNRAIWYRSPLYRRLLPIGDVTRRESDRLGRLYTNKTLVSIYDRNIGILLDGIGDKYKDDGHLLGQLKKVRKYYEEKASALVEVLGQEQYQDRFILFDRMIKAVSENTILDKNEKIALKYDVTINDMITEIERTEANVELEEYLKQ